MSGSVNNAEQFVYDVCQRSFLALWSYVNPQGRRPGKELCDILVVCDPHVIVVSVKDIKLKNSGKGEVDWDRWRRKAIDDSIRQIKGAIRWLNHAERVTKKDGSPGLLLPPLTRRIYHRIAIAFGGSRKVPISSSADKGEDIFHILDEQSFYLILRHLDTISDFVQYLSDKEQLLSHTAVIISGGEENLLAMYLHNGRQFQGTHDFFILEDDLWAGLNSNTQFLAKLERDQDSYLWDTCINALARSILDGSAYFDPGLSNAELGLREMAMEDRFSRRCLSKALLEFKDLAQAGKIRSRMVFSINRKTTYVFMIAKLEDDPSSRLKELTGRCWVALSESRKHDQEYYTAIGLALGALEPGHPLELVYLHKDEWTDEDQKTAEKLRDDFGLFRSPQQKMTHEDEYPEET